jgi:hypothetical protein
VLSLLKARGVGMIDVSRRLDEAFAIARVASSARRSAAPERRIAKSPETFEAPLRTRSSRTEFFSSQMALGDDALARRRIAPRASEG